MHYIFTLLNSLFYTGIKQGFGSGSGFKLCLDPDPDPDSTRIRIRIQDDVINYPKNGDFQRCEIFFPCSERK